MSKELPAATSASAATFTNAGSVNPSNSYYQSGPHALTSQQQLLKQKQNQPPAHDQHQQHYYHQYLQYSHHYQQQQQHNRLNQLKQRQQYLPYQTQSVQQRTWDTQLPQHQHQPQPQYQPSPYYAQQYPTTYFQPVTIHPPAPPIPTPPPSMSTPQPFQGVISGPQLIDSFRTVPQERLRDITFVFAHLKRSSFDKPWGISFSKFEDDFILGNVNEKGPKFHTVWSHVVLGSEQHLDCATIYEYADPAKTSSNGDGTETCSTYTDRLEQYAKHISNPLSTRHHQHRLLPGDMILAIDGKKPASFITLTDITKYFRKLLSVTLVLVRMPQITTGALALWNPKMIPHPPPDHPFQVAAASHKLWKTYLTNIFYGPQLPASQTSSSISASSSAMARQVSIEGRNPTSSTVSVAPPTAQQVSWSSSSSSSPPHIAQSPFQQQYTHQLYQQQQFQHNKAYHLPQHVSTSVNSQPKVEPPPTSTTTRQPKFDNPLDLLSQVAIDDSLSSKNRSPIMQSPMTRIVSIPPDSTNAQTTHLSTLTSTSKQSMHQMSEHKKIRTATTTITATTSLQSPSYGWRNGWFKKDGMDILFDDNLDYQPEDGTRSKLFLPKIGNFNEWLTERKKQWKKRYKVYKFVEEIDEDEEFAEEERTVAVDFWTRQGMSSFDEWLNKSLATWKFRYSWNQVKRKRIRQECEEIVHLSCNEDEFRHWLKIRKNQWRLQIRKRQRQRQERVEITKADMNQDNSGGDTKTTTTTTTHTSNSNFVSPQNTISSMHSSIDGSKRKTESFALSSSSSSSSISRKRLKFASNDEMVFFDDILEEEERQRKSLKERPPLDISFLFDSLAGAPDDIVVHCFEFLDRKEHGKMLCISKSTSTSLKARENVWRQLCPTRWILPRRPRKPWHELYITKLRIEREESQKRWDDILLKCSSVLSKGDQLQTIEKLICKGERDIGFTVNYISPVVCERNSILNLAVIHKRYKIVRWLIDTKHADIESYDRGNFTPLLNSAWNGDKTMVRYLLQRGADRSTIGTGHYSQALAPSDFTGLTAEGWARKRGYDDVAELIRLGI